MAEHIPAWKKLGLKLKFAKDTPELPLTRIAENGTALDSNVKKRKHLLSTEPLNSGTVASQLSKKQKKFKTTKTSSPSPILTSTLPSVETEPIEDIPHDPTVEFATPPGLGKRKSVSFTPETKTTDGEGTKKLYTAWLAQQSTDFDPATAAEALRLVTSPSFSEHTATIELKQRKVANKPDIASELKAASAPHSEPSPHILATLQYLKDFHTAKDTWKFSKGKQNQVLKYALDTFKIPPEYDPALYAYMSSLQSPAARKRVRDEALAIREDDSDIESGRDMSSEGDTDAEDGKENNPLDDEEGDEAIDDSREDMVDQEASKIKSTGKAAAKAQRAATKAARRQVENTRRRCYRQALRRYKKLLKANEFEREEREKIEDPEWRIRLLKRKRAELLLWSVGAADAADEAREIDQTVQLGVAGGMFVRPGTVETGVVEGAGGETAAKRQKLDDGAVRVAGKRKRKRKRRTGVPDDDSSSTESSSSSDSALSDTSEEGKTHTSSSEDESSDVTSSIASGSTGRVSSSSSEGRSRNGSQSSGKGSSNNGTSSANDATD